MPLPNDTLNLLLEAIREVGPHVFASPEDADFFRKRKVPAKIPSPPPPLPAIEIGPPARVEKISVPKPAIIEKSAPPKPISVKEPISQEEIFEPKPSVDFSSVRNILSVVAPELAIINQIPSDAMAKKIAERWKTKNQTAPISILLFQEPPEQRALLEQVAKAIDIYFGPAKIVNAEGIEKDKQWEAFLSVADLKMIIVCDYTLWQLNSLMQFYKETPAQGVRALGNIPLFLLPDLSLYLKDPLLKRSLWKALCQKFS